MLPLLFSRFRIDRAHRQPHRQAGDLLEDLTEITVDVGEQPIELGPNTVSGSYSLPPHGR
jgi:hypothetical protein